MPSTMFDESFYFCLFFSLFSYKLLFWSDRNVSVGAIVLTVCCALSLTKLIIPNAHHTFYEQCAQTFNSTTEKIQPLWERSWLQDFIYRRF